MSRFLRNAILNNASPYSAVLPYNLNWMVSAKGLAQASNIDCGPITLLDVGCRGGIPEELWPIRHLINYIGFDADSAECARLNAGNHDLSKRELFPFFVGPETGEAQFHFFKSSGESSSLRPDPRFARLFGGDGFAIERTVTVEATSLDDFFRGRSDISRPDIIKLDTQGTELSILQGGKECLRTACLVEVEVEFTSMYEGQPLFPDVMRYMLDSGFELLYLNRVFQQRKDYRGFAKGQLTFGDALFYRREDLCDGFDDKKMTRYLLLLVNYGHLDIASHILETRRFSARTRAFFERYLKKKKSKLRNRLTRWIDKLALFLLHMRKHNGLRIDSDRSWPFR
jgi:FkbM family methyltransferase